MWLGESGRSAERTSIIGHFGSFAASHSQIASASTRSMRCRSAILLANVCHMSSSDTAALRTGTLATRRRQRQQAANFIQREAKLPRSTDEFHPGNVVAIITSELPLPTRPRQQSDPLVI